MTLTLTKVLAFLLLFAMAMANAHPLKISVTDVVYKDEAFHRKCKLFTDDLEMTLRE